jgi:cytochrome c biogenesis protein CcmG, thiol:disulfide interchange protein DsbE
MARRGSLRKKIFLFTVILTMSNITSFLYAANTRGDNFLELTLVDLDGKKVRLDQLAEDKPLLLYFWATWCKPCRKTQPKVAALAEKYKDRVKVVGINVGGLDAPKDIKKYISRQRITYTMLIDHNDEAVKAYSVSAIPVIILLDTTGKILFRDNEPPANLDKFFSG